MSLSSQRLTHRDRSGLVGCYLRNLGRNHVKPFHSIGSGQKRLMELVSIQVEQPLTSQKGQCDSERNVRDPRVRSSGCVASRKARISITLLVSEIC